MPRRVKNGFTVRQIETWTKPGHFADGNYGLYLQCLKSGEKTWVARFTSPVHFRRRDMGLGSVREVSLVDAREAAFEARKEIRNGVDPIDKRKAEKKAKQVLLAKIVPFRDCAIAYMTSRESSWSAKSRYRWASQMERFIYPVFGNKPVAEIDSTLIIQALDPIWPTKTETASKLRGRIEAVLDYAKVNGHRDGENPARWKGNLSHHFPAQGSITTVRHHKSLPYSELPAFWVRLQEQDGMAPLALAWTLLTTARTKETLGARYSEIDFKTRTWTVPAERMKAKKLHKVPLSEPALAVLRKVAVFRVGDMVFPTGGHDHPMSNMAMAKVLERMRVDFRATVHGMRATFRTWAAECTTGYPNDTIEAQLAHVSSKLVQAYQRGDLLEARRKLVVSWAQHVTSSK